MTWAYSPLLPGGAQQQSGPAVQPFAQSDWPLTFRPISPENLKTWVESYNWAMIGQDQLPFRQQHWPLPIPPWRLDQTYLEWYNLTLVGQDKFPPGKVSTELTTKPYEYHAQLRSWVWQYNLNLRGKDQLPVGEVRTELAPGQVPPRPMDLRTWTDSYNLTLIGKDQLPFRQRDWPTPKPADDPAQLDRGFTFSLSLALTAAPIGLPPGEQLFAAVLPPSLFTLGTWTQNLLETTLVPIPPDTTNQPLPFDWGTPEGYEYRDRTYLASSPQFLLTPVTAQNPFFQTSWPLTPAAPRLDQSITASFNKNLTGQDQLPAGEISTALWTKSPESSIQLRSWTWNYNLNLIGKDQLPVGEVTTALTVKPPEYHIQLRNWTWSYNLNLVAQDKLPFRQTDWPLTPAAARANELSTWIDRVKLLLAVPFKQLDWPNPRAPQQPAQSFTGSYNLNLIAQDQLPSGEQISDIPPQPTLSAIQLRTWINQVNLALVITPAPLPFNQYDWPINPGPRQPTQIFFASYNKNLIGKDKLPVGEIVTDLPPQPARQPIQIFVSSYDRNLIGKDKLPVGENVTDLWPRNYPPPGLTWLQGFSQFRQAVIVRKPFAQYDWQVPRGTWDGLDRTIAARSQFLQPFIPPPTPELPNVEAPPVRDYWDRDEWGNFIKGYCVRGT